MKTIIPILLAVLAIGSCNKKQLCAGTETTAPATIQSITGPDRIAAGDTAAIVLTIAQPDNACIRSVEGRIVDMRDNYVQVGATVTVSPSGDEQCNCLQASGLKTLVYFTPETKGTYLFGTKQAEETIGNASPDTSVYILRVP
ncbi:hypothetical protein [Rurimicrobium arvi]|uniref:Lipoprotein n=1 Tax=Rurimicrobium arvi TaxID=2049916 RepID=A0ABP8MZB2_9BACT